MSYQTTTCENQNHGHDRPVVYTDLTGVDPCPAVPAGWTGQDAARMHADYDRQQIIEVHADHDLWPLISQPGRTWCRTCQVHFDSVPVA